MKIEDFASEPQALLSMPSTLTPNTYVNVTREMNIHDFLDEAEGGRRLVSAADSARREVGFFLDDRNLRLAEPMHVRITISVEATGKPKPIEFD